MAPLSPYTYIQCPCSDPGNLSSATRSSNPSSPADEDCFDPRAPRSNYSLYPLEYLLFCDDCHQIRCPRCVAEEIVAYYCPSCLFEVPSSNLKSEGNRCTRSCFQCPVCIGPLSVSSLETQPESNLLSAPDNAPAPHTGPYILSCSYCNWSSTEIGITFDKPNNIHAQLAKQRNGGTTRLTAKERKDRRKDMAQSGLRSQSPTPASPAATSGTGQTQEPLDLETQFTNLKTFYQRQLAESNSSHGSSMDLSSLGDLGFASPNSLSRIMSIYTGGGLHDKKAKARAGVMREALSPDEGLQLSDLDESPAIAHLHTHGHAGTITTEQRLAQPPNLGEPHLHGATRFESTLRPIPYLLRTKRSKRCPICRHIISKPEAKVQTTRFRIRLVAGSYIPSITIKPLNNPAALPETLEPLKPVQYVLTFKNPIFDPVKITLASPSKTPGRFGSKVTVLCPQFEIDANTDVWDEALKDGGDASGTSRKRQQQQQQQRRGDDGGQQAEAGKIWERGRNWVSIVVEVVPASLRLDRLATTTTGKGQDERETKEVRDDDDEEEEEEEEEEEQEDRKGKKAIVDTSPLKEDEDVLEIPMFVRIEWEADSVGDDMLGGGSSAPARDKDVKEKRELAYWCVLGLGRVRQD
ncbi:dynactin p62 family-domain-containing protein [Bombardia bombarda]|uniref:Dynactin subunit 4 n=1 Tax=Bombardia bombarda TaxID=252184 RepID=A0AA39XCB9_9PEZI|nr:dynactin p62 family-domain-containing protein [Bombardia bombarda]